MNSRRLLVLLIASMVAIAACQNIANQPSKDTVSAVSSDATDCRTVKHEMGETKICGQPQRIVVLGPYVLEPLIALDVQPVGYADHVAFRQGDYTDPRQQIPYLGDLMAQPTANVGTASQPSIEAIIKAQPDLILATEFNASEYDTFSKIAPTLLLNYWEPEQNLRALALATNRTEQADQLLIQIAQQLEEAQETFTGLTATHPKVALLSPSDLQNIQVIPSSASHCGSLIEELGFQLVFPPGLSNDDSNVPAPISLESLPQLNDADIVILLGYNFSDFKSLESVEHFEDHQLSKLKQEWEENPIAQSLDASKAGRVYFIPAYLCSGLPGPIGTELYLEELKKQLLSSE